MKVRNVRHKGLRRFLAAGDASGLPAPFVEKIRNILSFVQEIDDAEELRAIPSWGARLLGGDRKGCWSLSVSRNWRLTFHVDDAEQEIVDLDFEDYH